LKKVVPATDLGPPAWAVVERARRRVGRMARWEWDGSMMRPLVGEEHVSGLMKEGGIGRF
jgi:hypothetical protein